MAALEGRRGWEGERQSISGETSGQLVARLRWRLTQMNVVRIAREMRRNAPPAAIPAMAGTERISEGCAAGTVVAIAVCVYVGVDVAPVGPREILVEITGG